MTRHLLAMWLSVWASQYSPGTMEATLAHRGYAQQPAIAVMDCNQVGHYWWIRRVGDENWHKRLVADCARPGDGTAEWMERNRIGLEIDYPTAVLWDTVGRGIRVQVRGPTTATVPTLER